jgi:selenide,water dikinase
MMCFIKKKENHKKTYVLLIHPNLLQVRNMNGNMDRPPLISDIVLVGGGHAHVHALKMFGMPPLKNILQENGIQVTLISSSSLTPYSGMLPGFIAGHYTRDEIHLDLRKLCSFSGIRFIHAAANGITYKEGGGGSVSCSDGRPDVRYDVISIDIGSSPSMPSSLLNADSSVFIETSDQNVTPVKPIASFSDRWEGICNKVQKISLENLNETPKFRLLVVGGGAGGIELALSAQYALQRIVQQRLIDMDHVGAADCEEVSKSVIKVSLATRGNNLLPSHNDSVRTIFERILKERNIDVYMGADAVGVDYIGGKKTLKLSPESEPLDNPILFDECLWCTSAGVSSWLQLSTPFDTVNGGFLSVGDTYESTSHPGVFAAGDCCHMVSNPRPKAGVFAVRAGECIVVASLYGLFLS